MRAGLRGAAHRLALTLAGEGAQSAFHFVVNVALARNLDVQDYGVFAVVMVIGAVALTYMRALVGLPASLLVSELASGRRGARAIRAVEAAFGSAAAMLGLAVAAAAAFLFAVWLRRAAVPAGLFVGLWSFRSYLRTVLLAERRQNAATISDLTLVGAGAALALPSAAILLPPRSSPVDPLAAAFLILAGANLAAIGVALAANRTRPRFTLRRSMRTRFAALGRQLAWSAAATTSANAQATGQVLLVAVVAGPPVYAPMAAMLALFAPVRLLVAGLTNLLIPELAAAVASDAEGRADRLRRVLVRWTAFALAAAGLYGAVAAAILPMMGSTVFAGQPTGVIFGLAWGTTASFFLSLVPRLLLEVRRQFRLAATVGTVGAILGMAVILLVLRSGQPAWALAGNLLGEVVTLIGAWVAVMPRRGPGRLGSASPRPRAVRLRRLRRPVDGLQAGGRPASLEG